MLILSWNIKGVGGRRKCDKMKEFIVKYGIENACLQKTKSKIIQLRKVLSLWPNDEVYFDFVPAEGLSGGLVSIWDNKSFKVENFETPRYWITLWGEHVKHNIKILVIDVYSPSDLIEKKELWMQLTSMLESCSYTCCVAGDFNAVRDKVERKGCLFDSRGTKLFNRFINKNGLVEM